MGSYTENAAQAGVSEFTQEFVFNTAFWQQLDEASQDFVYEEIGEIETAFAIGALGFTSLTIGLFARAALLGISLGATYSQPMWVSSFDFMTVIDTEDEESIEQIIDNKNSQPLAT